MMKTFDEVSSLIKEGRLLHIAGNAELLRKLPKGNWIGGSTDYFMAAEGGLVSDTLMFVTEFAQGKFSICDYGADNINKVAMEAYDSGYSILIMPFNSPVAIEYTLNAREYEDMYIKNIVGWVSGAKMDELGLMSYPPIAVNGARGEVFLDRAVVLHLEVPESKTVSVNIINIFDLDENSPPIEFENEGIDVTTCRVGGKEVILADYMEENNFDTKLPIISNCFGFGLNVDISVISDGVVRFSAPVFPSVKYYRAKEVSDYEATFNKAISNLKNVDSVFSCNCLSNFLYGNLEGKKWKSLFGPIVFGEIAYQMLSQTLVYVTLE